MEVSQLTVEVKDQLCVWLALINKESGYKHENRSLIQSLALMRLAMAGLTAERVAILHGMGFV